MTPTRRWTIAIAALALAGSVAMGRTATSQEDHQAASAAAPATAVDTPASSGPPRERPAEGKPMVTVERPGTPAVRPHSTPPEATPARTVMSRDAARVMAPRTGLPAEATTPPAAVPAIPTRPARQPGILAHRRADTPDIPFRRPEGDDKTPTWQRPEPRPSATTGLQHGRPQAGRSATAEPPPVPRWYKTPARREPG